MYSSIVGRKDVDSKDRWAFKGSLGRSWMSGVAKFVSNEYRVHFLLMIYIYTVMKVVFDVLYGNLIEPVHIQIYMGYLATFELIEPSNCPFCPSVFRRILCYGQYVTPVSKNKLHCCHAVRREHWRCPECLTIIKMIIYTRISLHTLVLKMRDWYKMGQNFPLATVRNEGHQ